MPTNDFILCRRHRHCKDSIFLEVKQTLAQEQPRIALMLKNVARPNAVNCWAIRMGVVADNVGWRFQIDRGHDLASLLECLGVFAATGTDIQHRYERHPAYFLKHL